MFYKQSFVHCSRRMEKKNFWRILETNWDHFYWLTAEVPHSMDLLVNRIRQIYTRRQSGRRSALDLRNQVLLTMIWLRRYPTLHHLAMHFSIPVTSVHRIIPLLHNCLVNEYINWHDMNSWRNLRGTFPTWPNVVAILDCTPFRISKPAGNLQRLFYRGDRHCFFLNWIVIIDVNGLIVLSRPGFVGHINDSTCLDQIRIPVLPQGLQIMADQGFINQRPILVPLSRRGNPLRGLIRRDFSSCRNTIERCFGTLKCAYTSAGTRRFRHRHWIGPLICNLSAALYNRRKKMFLRLRHDLGFNP